MKFQERRNQLLRQSHEVMARQTADEKHLAASTNSMAEPGDLFVCGAAGDLSIEWLVLASEPSRLLLLPVDDSPLAGSRDLEVMRPSGTSWVRCGVARWIGDGAFESSRRTGRLETAELVAVRDHQRMLETAAFEPSLAALETDEDPDYRAWMADVEAAVARLEAEYPMPAEVVPLASRRRVPRYQWPGRLLGLGGWAAAAALVLFVIQLESRIWELKSRIPSPVHRVPVVYPHLPPPELTIQGRTRGLELGTLRVREDIAALEIAQARDTDFYPHWRVRLLRDGETLWESAVLDYMARWDLEIPLEWLGGTLIIEVWGITDGGLEVEVDAWALRDRVILAREVGGSLP